MESTLPSIRLPVELERLHALVEAQRQEIEHLRRELDELQVLADAELEGRPSFPDQRE